MSCQGEEETVVGSEFIPDEQKEKYNKLHMPYKKGNYLQESTKFYDAEGFAEMFDKCYANLGNGCNGPRYAAEQLGMMTDNKSIRVLDVAAGTGFVGVELVKEGFTNVDALEPSIEMLRFAEEKGIYNNTYCDALDDHKTEIADDTYDAAVMSGGMGEGHIPCRGLKELIRIVKPGGWVVVVTRHAYIHVVKEYIDQLEPFMAELTELRKWSQVKKEVLPEYDFNQDGIVYIFKVLESGCSDFKSDVI